MQDCERVLLARLVQRLFSLRHQQERIDTQLKLIQNQLLCVCTYALGFGVLLPLHARHTLRHMLLLEYYRKIEGDVTVLRRIIYSERPEEKPETTCPDTAVTKLKAPLKLRVKFWSKRRQHK